MLAPSIQQCRLPTDALLNRYAGAEGYADCYATDIAQPVALPEFVEAFYTTAVFKLERLLLGALAARSSTDAQASQLARGEIDAFAAWSVEGRTATQLLLSDFTGRTRSWLMAVPMDSPHTRTRLFFGSAVVATRSSRTGRAGLGPAFAALLGFHKLYSRVLLSAARSRLSR